MPYSGSGNTPYSHGESTAIVDIELDRLSDVQLVAPVEDNQHLVYNGGVWTNDYTQKTFIRVRNETGVTINKGSVVHAYDVQNSNVVKVVLADASDPIKMPAIGIVLDNILNNENGLAVSYGRADSVDTTGFILGETLYVSNVAGQVSNVKPLATTDKIQNIGVCIKVGTNGSVFVTGIGRANDIPNAEILPDDTTVQYVYINTAGNDFKKVDPLLLNTKVPTLQEVTDTGNTTTNVVQFQNTTTAFVVTENNAQIKFDSNIIINSNETRISIGKQAGASGQNSYSVAIGSNAGELAQSSETIAIGSYAGYSEQGQFSVAIGESAGSTSQNEKSIAIGALAGINSLGSSAIAIGYSTNALDNSIVLNASGSQLYGSNTNATYINPVRFTQNFVSNVISIQTDQKEVVNSGMITLDGPVGNVNVNGNLVVSDYYYGNAYHLVSLTDAAAGTYGSATNVAQIGVDATGRITSITDVPISVSLGLTLNITGSDMFPVNNVYTFASVFTVNNMYRGGVLAPNGKIYCMPYNVYNVGVIDPSTETTYTFGVPVSFRPFHGGVLAPNGKIYGIPFYGSYVGIIDPATDTYTNGPFTFAFDGKFHGGVLAANKKIYCIPAWGGRVGVIDTVTDTYYDFVVSTGASAFHGGVLAPNGKIYCIPHNETSVGVIDPVTDTYSTFGSLPTTTSKYGGGILAPNGKIYCIPYNSGNIGVIDPNTNTFSTFTTGYSGSKKYYGGVLAPNGKIYCTPFNTNAEIGVIDPNTNTFSVIGPIWNSGAYYGAVVGTNGRVYFIPFNQTAVLVAKTGFPTQDSWVIQGEFNKL